MPSSAFRKAQDSYSKSGKDVPFIRDMNDTLKHIKDRNIIHEFGMKLTDDWVYVKATYMTWNSKSPVVLYCIGGKYTRINGANVSFTDLIPLVSNKDKLPDLKQNAVNNISYNKTDKTYTIQRIGGVTNFEFYKVDHEKIRNIDGLIVDLRHMFDELRVRPVDANQTNVSWIGEDYRAEIEQLYFNTHNLFSRQESQTKIVIK